MKYLFFFFSILLSTIAGAQSKLPILKSNGTTIKIREGRSEIHEQHPVAAAKPDMYVPKPFAKIQQITYISDIDSISFDVKPNKKYDFMILQNNSDTIYTQINTSHKAFISYPNYSYSKKNTNKTDTIPFAIGSDSRIYIKSRINQSDTLTMLFDTGASASVISTSAIEKKVKIDIDGTVLNAGSDGISRVSTSSLNTIDINSLVWNNVPLYVIDFGEEPFDGVLGWVAFQNKVIKINYETEKIVVYDSLPKISPEFSKVDFKIIDGIPFIKCKMIVAGKEYEEWFDFDSGSDGSISISNQFANQFQLQRKLQQIGEGILSGSAGVEVKIDFFLMPRLKIGDFELYNTQLSIPQTDPETPEKLGNVGNFILKRFTTIIDFQNHAIYLRPNNLFYSEMY